MFDGSMVTRNLNFQIKTTELQAKFSYQFPLPFHCWGFASFAFILAFQSTVRAAVAFAYFDLIDVGDFKIKYTLSGQFGDGDVFFR